MAAGELFDLSGQQALAIDRIQNPVLPSGTKSGTASGTSTENTSTSSAKSINSQNTPNFALNALQALISQLQDKPLVSEEQAQVKYPSLRYGYGPFGDQWGLIDPLTGNFYRKDDPIAMKLQAERTAQRQQMIQQGGIAEGGTVETRRATTQRQEEISRNRAQQTAYSKDAAFNDADALAGRFTRQLLEQLMPNINKAVEGSGTSGGAVSGLLAQDAAARTAEAQAALGLQTAVSYGQINNQLASTLELLTRMDQSNPTTQLLLQALNTAKGTINQGVETAITNSTSTKNTEGVNAETQLGIKPTNALTAPPASTPQAPAVSPVNTGPSYMSITKNSGNQELLSLISDLSKNSGDSFTSGYQF